jgi:hypothetical protein
LTVLFNGEEPIMRRITAVLPGVLVLAAIGVAGPVSEVEITPDPPLDGLQTFDVRFTPGETRTYDKLTFDCVLRQEFPKNTTDQRSGVQVHEPEVFTYRRRDVKMVEELDVHVAFKVPVSTDRLKEIFGLTAFNTNYPVTVPRMTITAEAGGKKVWSLVCETKGILRPDGAPPKEAPQPPASP